MVVKYSDPNVVRRNVELYVRKLKNDHDEILRVIWFGSWIVGGFSPGSDVDLCIIVKCADSIPRDRPIEYLPRGFLVGLDICVYTDEEFNNLPHTRQEWHTAISKGVEVRV